MQEKGRLSQSETEEEEEEIPVKKKTKDKKKGGMKEEGGSADHPGTIGFNLLYWTFSIFIKLELIKYLDFQSILDYSKPPS